MSNETARVPSPHEKRGWMRSLGVSDGSPIEINFGFGLEQTHYRGVSREGDIKVSGSRASKPVTIEPSRITLLQEGWRSY